MQEILILIISYGELQVNIGNIYLGIYAKCFCEVAEPLQIKPNIDKKWGVQLLKKQGGFSIFSFSSFHFTFPSLRK